MKTQLIKIYGMQQKDIQISLYRYIQIVYTDSASMEIYSTECKQ